MLAEQNHHGENPSMHEHRPGAPDKSADTALARRRDTAARRLPADFDEAISDVWRQLAHSLMRNHAVFEAFGKAISAPGTSGTGRLARSAESYEWEESRANALTTENLEQMLLAATGPEQSSRIATAWKAVNELEHIAECGQRGWMLAIRESEGKFSLGGEARDEIMKISHRLEELFYWTLESMRLLYNRLPESQATEAARIAARESAVAGGLFKKAVAGCRQTHGDRHRSGRCAIPGGVAFLDYVATMDRAGGHLAAILELTASPSGPGIVDGATGSSK